MLDENFPKSVIPLLLEGGHEVIELRSLGLLGASDALIAGRAIDAGAVILTTDRDFFHTVPNTFGEHPGVVILPVPSAGELLAPSSGGGVMHPLRASIRSRPKAAFRIPDKTLRKNDALRAKLR